jgi:hypothetical protein
VTTRDHARRARLVLDGHAASPIGLVVTGHAARDVYGYGYGEIWQPDAPQMDLPAEEPAMPGRAAQRPAPTAQHSQPPRGRSRTRLSWLRF